MGLHTGGPLDARQSKLPIALLTFPLHLSPQSESTYKKLGLTQNDVNCLSRCRLTTVAKKQSKTLCVSMCVRKKKMESDEERV